jgi:hypothetical protein
VFITRPHWGICNALRHDHDGGFTSWTFENVEGIPTGDGVPAQIAEEDRAATDWMLYQSPKDKWVYLHLMRE